MNLKFPEEAARNYKSPSQIIRVLTESWFKREVYCPACGCNYLAKLPNNAKMADFFCEQCGEIYELKSNKSPIGSRILDGAYYTALERITSNTNPNLFVLAYNPEHIVENLTVVPKHFLTPNILQIKKALSPTARRHGFTGAYILYSDITDYGKISVVKSYREQEKKIVIKDFARASKLKIKKIDLRGWLMDILNCIEKIPHEVFHMEDMCKFIPELQAKHPDNNNVRAKIRQQLQFLAKKGFIEFVDYKGTYKKILR